MSDRIVIRGGQRTSKTFGVVSAESESEGAALEPTQTFLPHERIDNARLEPATMVPTKPLPIDLPDRNLDREDGVLLEIHTPGPAPEPGVYIIGSGIPPLPPPPGPDYAVNKEVPDAARFLMMMDTFEIFACTCLALGFDFRNVVDQAVARAQANGKATPA